MFEFSHCVSHGRQAVLTGRDRMPHPTQVSSLFGCTRHTAEAVVTHDYVVSVACGCVCVRDVDTFHELLMAEGGAR